MAVKVTEDVLKRIKYLKSLQDEDGKPLSNVVIAKRLGLGLRTVRFYLNRKDPSCTTAS